MKYRSKLFYSLLFVAILGALPALMIVYDRASRIIYKEIREKALIVATISAKLIDGDFLESVLADGKVDSEEHKAFQDQLGMIRDLGRTVDLYIGEFYIVIHNEQTDQYMHVIGISDKTKKTEKELHELFWIVDEKGESAFRHVIPFATGEPHTDAYGLWLSAFASIRNSKGQQTGILGVDINVQEVYQELHTLLFYGIIGLVSAVLLGVLFAAILSHRVTVSLTALKAFTAQIKKGEYERRVSLKTKDEFNDLALSMNAMVDGLEERERLKAGFTRYVSRHALEQILQRERPVSLKGERKKITVLFSDIRNFTSIAEHLPPEEVLSFLNEYFEKMIEIVFAHSGTLDKFIGDGMMVEFGAPLDDDKQEFHALSAAVHMQKELAALNNKWASEGKTRVEMGIGIHTGQAVVGNIGSERRMEYTAVGDTVNVAARLEQATKSLGKPIVISGQTYERVKDQFAFEDLNMVEIPGRKEYVKGYALILNKQQAE